MPWPRDGGSMTVPGEVLTPFNVAQMLSNYRIRFVDEIEFQECENKFVAHAQSPRFLRRSAIRAMTLSLTPSFNTMDFFQGGSLPLCFHIGFRSRSLPLSELAAH